MASFVRERVAALAWPRTAACAALASAFVLWELATPRSPVRIEQTLPLPGGLLGARLAMAALAAVALAALAFVLARTASRRVAGYAVVVLATLPAWFVHGRLSTTTMMPLAAAALVLAGLGLALVDDRASPPLRALGLVIAAAAAAIGAATGAALTIVAPATIGAGVAALVRGRRREGALACAVGLAVATIGCFFVLRGVEGPLASAFVGPHTPRHASTFDAAIAPLAYGFLPWSPLAALALGRRPSSPMHLAVVIAAGLSLVAHAVGAMRGPLPVVLGVASIGAAVAFTLDDVDRIDTKPGTLVPLVLVALGALVAHDVDLEPERVMIALGAKNATLPPAYVGAAAKAMRSSTWLVTALSTVALVAPRSWLPSSRGLALALAGALGGLVLRAHTVPTLLARLSPGAAIDAYARAHRPGDRLGTLGIDPKESATLATRSTPDERFVSSAAAASWLAAAAPTADRRFLAFAAPELPSLNAAFRRERHANVPVLAGGDGLVLLAVSTLTPGEKSENSLDAFLLDRAPADIPHPLDAVMGDRFDVLGWELTDDHGRRIAAAKQGKKSHLRLFLRVRDGGASAHCTFIHVEHTPTRYSIEHATHPEPMASWGAGDIVADDFDVVLPAAFRPGAYAAFWGVGVLPCHDDARMPITRGPNDGHDRLSLGALEVR